MFDADFKYKIGYRDYIRYMFDHTDENGIVYIDNWIYNVGDDGDCSYRCEINWNFDKCLAVSDEFDKLYNCLKKISSLYSEYTEVEKINKVSDDMKLSNVWNTYIRDFDRSAFDMDKISDISDRLDTIYEIKKISGKLSSGNELNDFEKDYLRDFLDITVSDEESKLYDKYIDSLCSEAESRIGKSVCAYNVLLGAMRLCRLFILGAPEIIIKNETNALAAAYVMHKYGKSIEITSRYMLQRIAELEDMDDDTLDEYFRPKKTNKRKSLAPLFVYLVLKESSNPEKPMRQQDIIEKLKGYPYEINLERKALSRIIHNLADSQLNIYSDPKLGTWYAK